MRSRAMCAAFLLAAAIASAESFEKSIPVPRSGETRLNWSSAGCSVKSVSLQNYPDREDIDKARQKDPNDNSWVWWNFHVENRGQAKCKIHLWVDVYDKGGKVAKSSDRSDTVDAGKYDDNIRVSTRMRTLDIADSPKAHVKADIGPK
jgi:hypothetical protein